MVDEEMKADTSDMGIEEVKELLHGYDQLQYARKRKDIANSVGIPVVDLDRLRKECIADESGEQGLQGREITFDEVEPYSEAVTGAVLLDAIVAQVNRFVLLPEHGSVSLALWVIMTYLAGVCSVLPMIVLSSPVKRSGKTTALECIRRLVMKPLTTSAITTAALFRVVDKYAPTLLIDEADTMFKENEELRTLVNASFTRTAAFSIRCVGENLEPRQFSTWCPKAIALIGELPPTIADRSIILHMKRRGECETVERLRAGDDMDFLRLRQMIVRFVQDHLATIEKSEPEIPSELNDRAADSWRELFRIADVAGEEWGSKARDAAVASIRGFEDEDDVKTILLRDIKAFLDKDDERSRYPSDEIVKYLVQLEGHPWAEWRNGGSITTNGLARALKAFGIKPHPAKYVGSTLQCYEASDFVESFSRYLGKKSNSQQGGAEDKQSKEMNSCESVVVGNVDSDQCIASCTSEAQPQHMDDSSNSFLDCEMFKDNLKLHLESDVGGERGGETIIGEASVREELV